MTDSKFDKNLDRQAVLFDFKNRVIDMLAGDFEPPAAGIYDEPVRYLKMNHEWFKLLAGWLSLMESEAYWKLAEDTNYVGIQGILTFEEGIEVVENCDDVEDCLETSDIITNINTSIINVEQGGSQSGNPANLDKDPQTGVNRAIGDEEAFNPTVCGNADKSALWGAINSFVDFVHATNTDLFEGVTGYTSKANLLASGIGLIPIIGLLTIDEGIEFVSQLADIIGVQYAANTTTTGLYQVKCDLFCQAVGVGCSFSVNDAIGYFTSQDGMVSLGDSASFQDYANAFGSVLTLSGMEWFCLISAMQLNLASMGETFVAPYGLKMYVRAAQAGALNPDGGYEAWCPACASHTGAWTIVLDFANDYVAVGSEIVYRNMYGRMVHVSGTASTLSNVFGKGIVFTNPGSQSVIKQLNITNAATCTDIQANVRKVSGTASSVGILNTSNAYTGQPRRNFSSGTFAWTTAVPLANAGGTPGALNYIRIDLNTTLASQTCVAEIRYLRITGTGALPKFS